MSGDVVDLAFAAARRRQRTARRAVTAARRTWRYVDRDGIQLSWVSGPRRTLLRMITEAQREAAVAADADVTALLEVQDLDPTPSARLVPDAFAGVASDGRDLGRLLDRSVIGALVQIQQGRTPQQALGIAGRWLEQVTRTQVADASRLAAQASTVARRSVGGFYRVASYPCCSRCAILAGRWYRVSASFQRHPRCNCSQVPAKRGALDDDKRIVHPQDYFDSLSHDLQDRLFTVAGAAAVRAGADITKVVNARRNMRTAGLLDSVFRQATTRDQAIALLRARGFLAAA